jgi:hypothetical protein
MNVKILARTLHNLDVIRMPVLMNHNMWNYGCRMLAYSFMFQQGLRFILGCASTFLKMTEAERH